MYINYMIFKKKILGSCPCSLEGSISKDCLDGDQCLCRSFYAGKYCDACAFYAYGYPECKGSFIQI